MDATRRSSRLPPGRLSAIARERRGRPPSTPYHVKPWLVAVALAALVLGAGPASASPREIAVTIDDLPVAMSGSHSPAEQVRITEKLLATLRGHGVPAIGFVNSAKLEWYGELAGMSLLERWLEAGFELGNHGHSHLDLHRVDPAEWEEECG